MLSALPPLNYALKKYKLAGVFALRAPVARDD
jgi:hypothetical protein